MFHVASFEEIKRGDTTDIYFRRTKKILKEKGIRKNVVAEVTTSSLPSGYKWGILAGIEEVARLFEGYDVNVYAMPEGSVFYPMEPVIRIEGEYSEFCELETALLGFICQASGIATKAARLRKVAGERILLSFGVRRMHPAIAPMIDRSAYIGGCDGFSCVAAEKLIGAKASGTMPHALIITVGDQKLAWKMFDEVIEDDVPRIALIDTFCDEKSEAIMACETIKNIFGVRLDTPSSRRGNMKKIVEEVRWELDIRGYKHVKIVVSGGIDEDDIKELDKVDAFGVGTSISNAKTIDFAMDIVEVEGKPVAKRGKLSGKKEVYRCMHCMRDKVIYYRDVEGEIKCEKCGKTMVPMLKPLIKSGKIVSELKSAKEIREYVLSQLQKLDL